MSSPVNSSPTLTPEEKQVILTVSNLRGDLLAVTEAVIAIPACNCSTDHFSLYCKFEPYILWKLLMILKIGTHKDTNTNKLDPVGSILCVTRWWSCVLGQYRTLWGGSSSIDAFVYCTKWRYGQVLPMPHSLTHRLWKIVLLSSLKSIIVELSSRN